MSKLQETYAWAAGCCAAGFIVGAMSGQPTKASSAAAPANDLTARLVSDAQQYYDLAGSTANHLQAFIYANYAVALLRVVDYKSVSADVSLPDLERNVEKRQQQLMVKLER